MLSFTMSSPNFPFGLYGPDDPTPIPTNWLKERRTDTRTCATGWMFKLTKASVGGSSLIMKHYWSFAIRWHRLCPRAVARGCLGCNFIADVRHKCPNEMVVSYYISKGMCYIKLGFWSAVLQLLQLLTHRRYTNRLRVGREEANISVNLRLKTK